MSLILQSMQIRQRYKNGKPKKELLILAMSRHSIVRRINRYPYAAPIVLCAVGVLGALFFFIRHLGYSMSYTLNSFGYRY